MLGVLCGALLGVSVLKISHFLMHADFKENSSQENTLPNGSINIDEEVLRGQENAKD